MESQRKVRVGWRVGWWMEWSIVFFFLARRAWASLFSLGLLSWLWVGYRRAAGPRQPAQREDEQTHSTPWKERKQLMNGNGNEINQMSLIGWIGMSLGPLQVKSNNSSFLFICFWRARSRSRKNNKKRKRRAAQGRKASNKPQMNSWICGLWPLALLQRTNSINLFISHSKINFMLLAPRFSSSALLRGPTQKEELEWRQAKTT